MSPCCASPSILSHQRRPRPSAAPEAPAASWGPAKRCRYSTDSSPARSASRSRAGPEPNGWAPAPRPSPSRRSRTRGTCAAVSRWPRRPATYRPGPSGHRTRRSRSWSGSKTAARPRWGSCWSGSKTAARPRWGSCWSGSKTAARPRWGSCWLGSKTAARPRWGSCWLGSKTAARPRWGSCWLGVEDCCAPSVGELLVGVGVSVFSRRPRSWSGPGAAKVPAMSGSQPSTLGELRASGWTSVPVRQELRRNAVARIRSGEPMFHDVLGFHNTVIPQVENALLAGHDMIMLGSGARPRPA